MPNRKLQELLDSAKTRLDQQRLDLKDVIRLDSKGLLEDLAVLDNALWCLPHITTLDLFPRYTLSLAWEEDPKPLTLYVLYRNARVEYRVRDINGDVKHDLIMSNQFSSGLKALTAEDWLNEDKIAPHLFELLKVASLKNRIVLIDKECQKIIKKILHNHPNIRSLCLDPSTGVERCSFNDKLSQNDPASMFPSAPIYYNHTDDAFRQDFFCFLAQWLKRKTLHAIIGNRPEELDHLLESHSDFIKRVEHLSDLNEKEKSTLHIEHTEVTKDFEKILDMNSKGIFPPRIDNLKKEWLVNTKATEIYGQWINYRLSYGPHLDLRGLDYDRVLRDLNNGRVDQSEKIGAYIEEHLGLECAQCYNELKDWYLHEGYSKNGLAEFKRQIERGLTEHFESSFKGHIIQASPLTIAFYHDSYEVFLKLLTMGANPFLSKGNVSGTSKILVLSLLETPDRGNRYLFAIVNHLKSCFENDGIEMRRLEFSANLREFQSYSDKDINALNHIYQVLCIYLIEKFPERLEAGFLSEFASYISGRKLLQKVTHTSTEDRAIQVFSSISSLQPKPGGEGVPFDLGRSLEVLKDKLKEERSSIFHKTQPGHFIPETLRAIEDFIAERAKTAEITKTAEKTKESAFSAKKTLHNECKQRDASQNAYILSQIQKDQVIAAEVAKRHYNMLEGYDNLEMAAARGVGIAESYCEALSYLLKVMTEGSIEDQDKCRQLRNYNLQYEEAQHLVSNTPVTPIRSVSVASSNASLFTDASLRDHNSSPEPSASQPSIGGAP